MFSLYDEDGLLDMLGSSAAVERMTQRAMKSGCPLVRKFFEDGEIEISDEFLSGLRECSDGSEEWGILIDSAGRSGGILILSED